MIWGGLRRSDVSPSPATTQPSSGGFANQPSDGVMDGHSLLLLSLSSQAASSLSFQTKRERESKWLVRKGRGVGGEGAEEMDALFDWISMGEPPNTVELDAKEAEREDLCDAAKDRPAGRGRLTTGRRFQHN
uniref:Uncharacterized protein n=1 Tax=Plectus sambesii TaxID=2011161 RepID=A0A914VH18_9BILA